jgi:hypothetical protein
MHQPLEMRLSQKSFLTAEAQRRRENLIVKNLSILCDSATLRFYKKMPFKTTSLDNPILMGL